MIRKKALSLVIPFLAHLLVAFTATAQVTKWAAWQFQWENDAFAAFSGSDEHYTNGLRFSWVRNPNQRANPEIAHDFAEWWCGRVPCGRSANPDEEPSPPSIGYGHSIIHTFYTPEDITEERLIRTDRPYAGHLSFGTQLRLRGDTDIDDLSRNQPTENYFDLQIGFVGPGAGARWLQTRVHEVIDDDRPAGWHHQLDFEPTLQLIYRWRRKIGNRTFDVVPHLGGGLGNVMTFAELGATARLGHNISAFPVEVIAPTASPVDLQVTKIEAYAYIGAAGRAVAHNLFLDVKPFASSQGIDQENWVYDLTAGVFARYKKFQFNYAFTRRSREFTPTFDNDGGRHDYGSVAVSYLIAWPPV